MRAQALAHSFFAQAAPAIKEGGLATDVDMDTAFKRAAVRSCRAKSPAGAADKGCYDRFWDACDHAVFSTGALLES